VRFEEGDSVGERAQKRGIGAIERRAFSKNGEVVSFCGAFTPQAQVLAALGRKGRLLV